MQQIQNTHHKTLGRVINTIWLIYELLIECEAHALDDNLMAIESEIGQHLTYWGILLRACCMHIKKYQHEILDEDIRLGNAFYCFKSRQEFITFVDDILHIFQLEEQYGKHRTPSDT